jgi:branched-chain amino acid transport system substrate-binding protein
MGQLIEQAVNATKSFDQKGIAKYLHENEHKTIIGSIKYGPDGEWKETATLQAQFRGVKDKNIEQFRSAGRQVILYPEKLKTGDLIVPFEAARK